MSALGGIDHGNPASVAAGNRAAADAPPDLTPILEALQSVAGAFPPHQQAIIGQCLQQLSQIAGGGAPPAPAAHQAGPPMGGSGQ